MNFSSRLFHRVLLIPKPLFRMLSEQQQGTITGARKSLKLQFMINFVRPITNFGSTFKVFVVQLRPTGDEGLSKLFAFTFIKSRDHKIATMKFYWLCTF